MSSNELSINPHLNNVTYQKLGTFNAPNSNHQYGLNFQLPVINSNIFQSGIKSEQS